MPCRGTDFILHFGNIAFAVIQNNLQCILSEVQDMLLFLIMVQKLKKKNLAGQMLKWSFVPQQAD